MMQNRYNCDQFVTDVKGLTSAHNIDITQCDIIEDFLLHLAEVKEKPKNSLFNIPKLYDPAFCVFAYEIDRKAVKQLLAFIEFSELKITDVTDEVRQSGKLEKLPWQPTLILRITADGLQKYFLPRLKKHLEQNPKYAKHYERLSHHTCKHLIQDIKKITDAHAIDINKCDVFEDFLLHLAEVKEKPTRSQLNIPGLYDKTHCVFTYGIDCKAVNQLLALNRQFPGLEVTDVTTEVNQRAGSQAPEVLDGQKTLILRMQVEALQKQILPLFKRHLEKDQVAVKKYQNFSYPFTRVYNTFLREEGLDITKSKSNSLLQEIIGTIVRERGMPATLLANSLNTILFPALISIIGSYLNLIEYKEESKQLFLTKGKILNYKETFLSEFLLNVPVPSAKLVALFFNQIRPHAAICYDQTIELKPGDKFARLVIDNEVLVHPSLLSDIKDTLQRESHEKLADCRHESGMIQHDMVECRTELEELAHSLPQEQLFNNLKTCIFELSKKNIEDSAEIKKTIDEIQTELNKIKEMRKEPAIRLFSSSSNDLPELLKSIEFITNKKFRAPAPDLKS